jgi:exodeoxyribonuclease V alpha subunit
MGAVEMILNKYQERAIELASTTPNLLISGGAGTGKTTIIKQIVGRFPKGMAHLAAPTGKAAARMKEATGFYAETLHRLLGLGEENMQITAGRDIAGEAVIVDESSMIDSFLLAKLIEARPQSIVLVGDDAQLMPIGAGSPFHDLLQIRPECRVHLEICYRSRASVNFSAQRIRAGIMPDDSAVDGEKFSFLQMTGEEAQDKVVRMFENGELDPQNSIVLASTYGSVDRPGTIKSLNEAIKRAVNPRPLGQEDRIWQPGDRVLNCKNFSAEDWWNGDTGTIVDVGMDGKNVQIAPDRTERGEIFITEREMLRELTYAWAMSVHKSQGSQWENVVFIAPHDHSFMLSRPLIYTAVTRAKKTCMVLGDRKTFLYSLGKVQKKTTALRLIAESEVLGL